MSSTLTTDNPTYLHEDVSYRLIIATTIILVVSTILVCLRLYIRTLPSIKSGPEDILLIPAYLLSLGACITGYCKFPRSLRVPSSRANPHYQKVAVTKGGAGHHVEYVVMKDPSALVARGKILFALSWVSGFSNCFSRLSVLIIYYRIFIAPIARACIMIMIAYMILFVISQSITAAIECRPLSHFWDQTVPGTCIDQFLFYKLSGILNILGDVAIMVFPLYTVWNMHASLAKRVGIALVFLSGSV